MNVIGVDSNFGAKVNRKIVDDESGGAKCKWAGQFHGDSYSHPSSVYISNKREHT